MERDDTPEMAPSMPGLVFSALSPLATHADAGYDAGYDACDITKRKIMARFIGRVITMAEQENGSAPAVESRDGISVVRNSENCREWNNINYALGLSGKNTNAKNLSMNVATVPPRGVAYAHIHDGFEVMLYILQGHVRHEYGPGLKHAIENQAGDFIFIEPGVPHEVYNISDTEPVVAVVARSAADEWDKIIPYDRNADTAGQERG
jgi:uncharacterized RmlC-like cupin family protein